MERDVLHPISGKPLEMMLGSLSQALQKEIKARVHEPSEGEALDGEKQSLLKNAKVYFCIGINDVTRTLERMPQKDTKLRGILTRELPEGTDSEEQPSRAVLVAIDVHPRILVSHLEQLCNSRAVPLVLILGGDGSGSLRLGELVGQRTAMAVGVKTGTSAINTAVHAILSKRA